MSRIGTLCLIYLNISRKNVTQILSIVVFTLSFEIISIGIDRSDFLILHYQKFAPKKIILLAIALINLWLAVPTMAATENFQLKSDRGYRLETSFDYEETEGRAIDKLDSLKVRFYNPDGEMMASYDNIVDGKVQGNYFGFDYDLATHQPLGEIDLGGESAGEMYLKGSLENGFSLIEVKPTGEEVVIDNGQWIMDNAQ